MCRCAPLGDTCGFSSGAGLTGADPTDEQKQLLLELMANWVGMADEPTTGDALAKIEATLDTTVIAWSGETTYDMTAGDGVNFSILGSMSIWPSRRSRARRAPTSTA